MILTTHIQCRCQKRVELHLHFLQLYIQEQLHVTEVHSNISYLCCNWQSRYLNMIMMTIITVMRMMICKTHIKQYHGPVPIVTMKCPYTFPHFCFITSKFMIYRKSLQERNNFCSQYLWVYCKLRFVSPTAVITHTHKNTHTQKYIYIYIKITNILPHQWYVSLRNSSVTKSTTTVC